jgi:RNA polymerase sigma factor (sigma-70 family)
VSSAVDHALVVAVRRGDDRAFEALYGRYHRRIAAYVLSAVRDHGRAEDVTQEVFVSALRGLRANDRPVSFEPWLFGIARNACIDHFRRSRRMEEVPLDLDEAGSVAGASTPDTALFAKQRLDDLRGAFGGLSDVQHEVLVQREFEGRSYGEIGERMGMSRVAVETALFRARKRLAEEYDELASGARCERIQRMISLAAEARLGARQSGRLARHVAHCQPCRRQALAAGVDSSILTYVPLRRRAAGKVAALLPVPGLARLFRGRGGAEDAAVSLAGGSGGGVAPLLSESLHAGWAKGVAVVAVLVAGAGATGVGTKVVGDGGEPSSPSSRPATEPARAVADATAAGDGVERVAFRQDAGVRRGEVGGAPGPSRERVARRGEAARGDRAGRAGRPAPADAPARDDGAGGGAGGGTAHGDGDAARDAGAGAGGGGGSADRGGEGGGSPSAPEAKPPAAGRPQPLKPAVDGVANTVGNTVNGVNETLQGVNQTLQGSPTGLDETLEGVNNTVGGATEGLGETVQGVTDGLEQTLGGLLGPRR